jgi:hypothetical protein
MWFGAEAARHSRLEGSLHRATASLAEILANQRLADNETITERLERAVPAEALLALAAMVGIREGEPDFGTALPGLKVTFYDTATLDPGTNEPYPPSSYQSGLNCDAISPPGDLAVMAESLITAGNVAQSRLVMVESCLSQSTRSVGSLVFPANMSSRFVTLVKRWEGD